MQYTENTSTNRLITEKSPYLLQHAHNPVDWYPWCEEAFDKAKAESKPVFLSIGYSSCHWCHVMERESFEDSEVAALLNEHYISIKVGREERPDLDPAGVERKDVECLVPYLESMPPQNGRAAAYLCRNRSCLRPVHSPVELNSLLQDNKLQPSTV